MRQAVMVVATFLTVSLFAGCSADPSDVTIEDGIKELNQALDHMNSLSRQLNTMVKKAKEAKQAGKENWKITKSDVKKLEEITKKLREVGERFVGVEERAKRYGEKLKTEERKALREKHIARIRGTLERVDKSYRELVEAKEEAIPLTVNKEVGDYLDEEMRIALQEFESLTRQ